MSDPVADQYEAYPYPSRNPQDEKTRLIDGSPSNLDEVDHYVFAGARDFRLSFRALVAGGGTGDGAILLAQKLVDRNCPAEIHYLDLSLASRHIAEARAKVRGLSNIRFHTGSLLDLPRLDLGRFDYIDCCGVLHHLADPAAGLASLAAVMAPDGGMGLMLYGALGRSGVYEAQAMLKALGSANEPLSSGIDLAKRLIAQLPATSALARNPAIGDYRRGEDAALVDLLLHRRDRAYRVTEIADLVSGAGLEVVSFINPWRYDPDSYLSDAKLKARLEALSPLQRASFAEMLAGNIKSHICYVVASGRAASAMARPDDRAAIPVLREADGAAFARAIRDDRISIRSDGLEMSFALPRLAASILSRIDGQQSIGEIGRRLEAEAGIRHAAFDKDFAGLYKVMNGIGRMTLRRPG
ncbi:MAG TPA: class I SAM-dependent methyltransferase [Candidatus Polarisedimenticolia bacterium]|nr:class I SAM-dependent methyltransferase [Candidatus Polarisedimenticolia bacterium]